MTNPHALGNHALCGQVARLLETHKIDGKITREEGDKLAHLMLELIARATAAHPELQAKP